MCALLPWEYDFGMEKGSRYSGGYGYEVALALEDFDLAGSGKLGQVDGTASANAGGSGFVGGDGRKLRQELAGMDEEGRYTFLAGNSRFLFGWRRFGMTRVDCCRRL
jgi:hypothetical protein